MSQSDYPDELTYYADFTELEARVVASMIRNPGKKIILISTPTTAEKVQKAIDRLFADKDTPKAYNMQEPWPGLLPEPTGNRHNRHKARSSKKGRKRQPPRQGLY